MATYIKLKKMSVVKGIGKADLDGAALQKFQLVLGEKLGKLGYELDLDVKESKPKSQTGYVLDGAITEISNTVTGPRALIAMKITMSVGTLPSSEMFTFLTTTSKVDDSSSERALPGAVLAAAEDAANSMASKIDLGIKNKTGGTGSGSAGS